MAQPTNRPIAQSLAFTVQITVRQGSLGDLDEYQLRHEALKEVMRTVGALSACNDARIDDVTFLESVDVKEKV